MRGNVAKTVDMLGDYVAGAVIGAVLAMTVRAVVWDGMDMVLAALIGVALGMIVHVVLGLVLTPMLGAFHAMLPGSLIGMYGGMFFAMRDAMQGPVSLRHAATVGAIFGAAVIAAVDLYDRVLHPAAGSEE